MEKIYIVLRDYIDRSRIEDEFTVEEEWNRADRNSGANGYRKYR